MNDTTTIPVGAAQVYWLRQLEGEDTLLGAIDLLGVQHHVYFIRVEEAAGLQRAVGDPYGRFDELSAICEDALQTVEVPGYAGEYVTLIHPFGA